MSAEQHKATAFVSRLLQNPALQPLTPLQREEQIIQFLHTNAAQLAPTLSSAAFFSGRSWNKIVTLLLEALISRVDEQLIPDLERLAGGVRFGFVNLLRQQSVSTDEVRDQVLSFLKGLLAKLEARRTFTGAYTALAFGVVDRYVDAIWERKSYVHFELTKVQRLKLSKDDVKAMIEATLLLKPSVHLVASGGAQLQSEQTSGIVPSQFAEKVFVAVRKQLQLVPEQVIRSGVNANVSYVQNRFIEATARLGAVFAARCRSYQPNVQVDRGADTPDASWLSIARRNYKFYGFDIKLLDELYSIAAENGW
ncbi:MAG: hypothetical protein ACOC2Y_02275 [Spirochaetota bacterium]